jgi:hypothetical protein
MNSNMSACDLRNLVAAVKRNACRSYARNCKDDDGLWKPCHWKPRDLIGNDPGIYALVYANGDIKIGMSFRCKSRVERLAYTMAVRIMDLDEIIHHVPQDLVDQIISLELPGLTFHKDHEDGHLEMLVLMQLSELKLATIYDCVTNTVGERLVPLPSSRVRKSIDSPQFGQNAIDFMKNIPDKGVSCLLTHLAHT